MHASLLRIVSAITLVLVASAAHGAQDPALRCQRDKLRAAGLEARAVLLCEQRGLAQGADPACLAAAAERRDEAFARADARGGCPTPGDSESVGSYVADLVQHVLVRVRPDGPGASRCSRLQIGASARAVHGLVLAFVRYGRAPDPVLLDAQVTRLEAQLDAALERAAARRDCLVSGGTLPSVAAQTEVIAKELQRQLCPACGVRCPCWSAAQLDRMFPAGFFDADGRGGAVCDFEAFAASLTTAESCVFHGPTGQDYGFPRAGAAVFDYGCLVSGDIAFNGGPTCRDLPSLASTTPEQNAACAAVLRASRPYRQECS